MKMTNRWNRIIYRLWAPVYDRLLDHFFLPGRIQALRLLDLKPGERLLLVGIGTGADLPLLPDGVDAVGVDINPWMLSRARSRLPLPGCRIALLQGDARELLVEQGTFDAVVFNLILSVIPDARTCLDVNLRALRPDGRAVVFDKFAPETGRISLLRRFLNLFSTLFGTDITRRFGEMLPASGVQVVCTQASLLRGKYQVFLLKPTQKNDDE